MIDESMGLGSKQIYQNSSYNYLRGAAGPAVGPFKKQRAEISSANELRYSYQISKEPSILLGKFKSENPNPHIREQ